MYFVVFIRALKQYQIIPTTWVQEIDANWQKFVNNGLNSNQEYTFFYSEQHGAFSDEGKPNIDYVPNFTNEIRLFPEEGCYYGNILKFFGKKIDSGMNIEFFKIEHIRYIIDST